MCRYAIAAGLFRAESAQERYLRCIVQCFAQHHCKHCCLLKVFMSVHTLALVGMMKALFGILPTLSSPCRESAFHRAAASVAATAKWLQDHHFFTPEEMQPYRNLVSGQSYLHIAQPTLSLKSHTAYAKLVVVRCNVNMHGLVPALLYAQVNGKALYCKPSTLTMVAPRVTFMQGGSP